MENRDQYSKQELINLGAGFGESALEFLKEAADIQAESFVDAEIGLDKATMEQHAPALLHEKICLTLHVADRMAFKAFGVEQREPFMLAATRVILEELFPEMGEEARNLNELINQRAVEYANTKKLMGEMMDPDTLTGVYAEHVATILGQPMNAMFHFLPQHEAAHIVKMVTDSLDEFIDDK